MEISYNNNDGYNLDNRSDNNNSIIDGKLTEKLSINHVNEEFKV